MRDSKRNVRICASVGRWSEWVGAGGVLSPGSAGGGGGQVARSFGRFPPNKPGVRGAALSPPFSNRHARSAHSLSWVRPLVLAALAFLLHGSVRVKGGESALGVSGGPGQDGGVTVDFQAPMRAAGRPRRRAAWQRRRRRVPAPIQAIRGQRRPGRPGRRNPDHSKPSARGLAVARQLPLGPELAEGQVFDRGLHRGKGGFQKVES